MDPTLDEMLENLSTAQCAAVERRFKVAQGESELHCPAINRKFRR